MFIVAEHIITNPNVFFEARAKIAQTPQGVKRLQSFPSVSRIGQSASGRQNRQKR